METNNRIALLVEACSLLKGRSEEQDRIDAVMVSMAQTAYQLGRADAIAEAESKKN